MIAATRSPVVNEALKRATGSNAPPTMQQRLWLLRCAFDTVLDELAEKEENGAAENGHAAKGE